MPKARSQGGDVRIDDRLVQAHQGRILCAGRSISVAPETVAVLACLVEQPGATLSQDEIIRKTWPGIAVEKDALSRAIAELQEAFAAVFPGQVLIRAVPGHGYQLAGRVEWVVDPDGRAPVAARAAPSDAGGEPVEQPAPALREPAPRSHGQPGTAGRPVEVAGLLGSLQAEDADLAWSRFIESYGPVILQVVRLYEKDAESVRETFLFVCEQLSADHFKRLRRYSPQQKASFVTWLRSVVRHLCVDNQRRASGRKRQFQFVGRLSDLEQKVYLLHYLENFTLEQTWHQLEGRFEGLTETQVSDAVERIYSLLTPRQLWLLSRRKGTRVSLSLEGQAGDRGIPDPIGSDLSPEELAIRKEELLRLTSCLLQLSESERRLLRLRFEEGYSLQACAEALGLENPQRAHRMISTLLSRLRVLLSNRPENLAWRPFKK